MFKSFKSLKTFKPTPPFDAAQGRLSSPASFDNLLRMNGRGRMKDGDETSGTTGTSGTL
jgi:hypothetical protein